MIDSAREWSPYGHNSIETQNQVDVVWHLKDGTISAINMEDLPKIEVKAGESVIIPWDPCGHDCEGQDYG